MHADYLIARYIALPSSRQHNIFTYVLRFPLCTPAVLSALLERPSLPHLPVPTSTSTSTPAANRDHDSPHPHPHDHHTDYGPPELPKRLFRQLSPSGAEALPLLHFLYASGSGPSGQQRMTPPNADSHDGYPLARAVSAGAVPLVRFLLDHGASPRRRNALAVRIAIRRKDLALVRLLIEPPDAPPDERRTGKRRRLADRIQVSSEMLKLAVTCGGHDIAEYLMNEKGCVPDLTTLSLLSYN